MISLFPDGVLGAPSLRQVAPQAAIPDKARSYAAVTASEFWGLNQTYGAGILSTAEAWKKNVWVRASIRANSDALAERPFEMYRGEDKVTKHPLLDLLAKPNEETPWIDGTLLKQMTFAIRYLFGECFWILERNGRLGFPSAIWVWHPSAFREVLDMQTGALLKWDVNFENRSYRIDPADVAHFPIYDPLRHHPFRPSRGTSPLESVRLAVSADTKAAEFNLGFFARNGVPPAILVNKDDLGPDATDNLVNAIKAKLASEPRGILALTGGWELIELGKTQAEASFIEGREQNREEILAAFGVPPVVLGVLKDANYATAFEQRKGWWSATLKPAMTAFCSVIHQKFLNGDPNLTCVLSVADVEELKRNRKEDIDGAVALHAAHVPWDVIDKFMDLGIGDFEGSDLALVPFNLIPAGEAKTGPKVEPTAKEEETAPPKLAPVEEKSLGDNWIDVAADESRTPLQIVAPEPLTIIGVDRASGSDQTAWRIVAGRAKPKTPDRDNVIQRLVDLIQEDDKNLETLSLGYWRQAYKLGVDQMAELLGLPATVDIKSKAAIAFFKQKLAGITVINRTTANQLRALAADGSALDGIIRDTFNQVSSRARIIAVTEIGQSVNTGRYQQLADGADRHEWVNSQDERVRPSHVAEDGNIVVIGKRFPVTGLLYPGDPTGAPGEVISCRCISMTPQGERAAFDRERYWRSTIAEWRPLEKRMERSIRKYLFEQRSRLLAEVTND